MARKKIVVSSAGGIAAGVPFAVGDYLFVQQATPPVAAGGRLKQAADAMQSITAKGLTAAIKTFVLGAAVAEGATQFRSILIGEDITAVTGGGVADRQILVGQGIAQLAAFTNVDLTVLIGNTPTFGAATGAFGNSVYIGHNQVITPAGGSVDTIGSVLLGNGATVNGGSAVGIGANSIVAAQSVNIGQASIGGGTQAVGVGLGTSVGNNSVAVGRRARSSADGVAIGFFSDTLTTTDGIAIGRDANSGAFISTAVIGRGSIVFESNAFGLGTGPTPYDMRVLRLGPNTEAGYPGLSIFLPSAAAGNNVAAPNTTFRGGISTGNSVTGGRIAFQSSTQGAAGAAYQAIVDRLRIAPGGVAGLPTIEFVNQISTPGVAVGTLLNAPAAGDPVVWAEFLYNGVLRKFPGW